MGFSVGVCIAALGSRGHGFNFREVHSTKSYKQDPTTYMKKIIVVICKYVNSYRSVHNTTNKPKKFLKEPQKQFSN